MLLDTQTQFQAYWKHGESLATIKRRTAYDLELRGVFGWITQDSRKPSSLHVKALGMRANEELDKLYGHFPKAKKDELGNWELPATEAVLKHLGWVLGIKMAENPPAGGWITRRDRVCSQVFTLVEGAEFVSKAPCEETISCPVLRL